MKEKKIRKIIEVKMAELNTLKKDIEDLEKMILTKENAEQITKKVLKGFGDAKEVLRAIYMVYPNSFNTVVKETKER